MWGGGGQEQDCLLQILSIFSHMSRVTLRDVYTDFDVLNKSSSFHHLAATFILRPLGQSSPLFWERVEVIYQAKWVWNSSFFRCDKFLLGTAILGINQANYAETSATENMYRVFFAIFWWWKWFAT